MGKRFCWHMRKHFMFMINISDRPKEVRTFQNRISLMNLYIGIILGKIGITIDTIWAEPRTNSTADIEAADRELQMSVRY